MPKAIKFEPGQSFGQLRVIGEAERAVGGQRQILCHCLDCDTIKPIRVWSIRTRGIKNCGCSKASHGCSRIGMPEYTAWTHMHQRCSNPDDSVYHNYGGRGIKVCERWNDFENFLADVGRRPSEKHSIDRYPDNDGNYEPGNVRWATVTEQARNRRTTVMITYKGVTKSVQDFAEEYGLAYETLLTRLKRGWSVHCAITTKVVYKKLSKEN